jgi:hypothetical protein
MVYAQKPELKAHGNLLISLQFSLLSLLFNNFRITNSYTNDELTGKQLMVF